MASATFSNIGVFTAISHSQRRNCGVTKGSTTLSKYQQSYVFIPFEQKATNRDDFPNWKMYAWEDHKFYKC